MTTYLGKSCSFCLPRVPFVDCRQFMYLVISLLVLRAGYGIWLYQFLIIAYLFTLFCLYCYLQLLMVCNDRYSHKVIKIKSFISFLTKCIWLIMTGEKMRFDCRYSILDFFFFWLCLRYVILAFCKIWLFSDRLGGQVSEQNTKQVSEMGTLNSQNTDKLKLAKLQIHHFVADVMLLSGTVP